MMSGLRYVLLVHMWPHTQALYTGNSGSTPSYMIDNQLNAPWSDPPTTKADSGVAVCLFGFQGASNVSGALRKYVTDPLRADLFVVSPQDRISLSAFEPFVGDVGQDVDDVEAYFDAKSKEWLPNGSNNWRSVKEIEGNWIGVSGAHQTISLMKCFDLIKKAEATRDQRYERILVSRLDFMWLQRHPVQTNMTGCWIPCPGNDFGGICDHHASCDRTSARIYMVGKFASILDPKMRTELHSAWRGRDLNSERHLQWVLGNRHVKVSHSKAAAFRSCISGSSDKRCEFIDAFHMWGKKSGSELADCQQMWQSKTPASQAMEDLCNTFDEYVRKTLSALPGAST